MFAPGFPAAYWIRLAWASPPLAAVALLMQVSPAPSWTALTFTTAATVVAGSATVGAHTSTRGLPPATRAVLEAMCLTATAVTVFVAAWMLRQTGT